jgi:hypothetical protein
VTAFESIKEQAAWLGGAIAVALAGGYRFKKVAREDKVDSAAGNATVDRIDALVKQAHEEYEKRLSGEQRISELDAENHRLGHELANCRMEIRFLKTDVRRLKKIFPDAAKYLGTTPGDFDEKPEELKP